MGERVNLSPKIKYVDSPTQVTKTDTDAYKQQVQLSRIAQRQNEVNMKMGARLDRANAEFFQTQALRGIQAEGAESRLNIAKQGQESRRGLRVAGTEERKGIKVTGRETRKTQAQAGRIERGLIGARGTQERSPS